MNNCSVSVRDQQNNLIAALISDNNGDFIVSGLSNGVYNIEISTTKIPGGITISDILNIRQNIAGLLSFNELQNKAADVNLSSSVSIADILPIRQKIAGIYPIPNWAAPNFVFSPLTFQISNQNALLIIQALSAGDVNGSHTP